MSYATYGPYLPVLMLIVFTGLIVWVVHPKNKQRFEEAAKLPFADDNAMIEKSDGNRKQDAQEGGKLS